MTYPCNSEISAHPCAIVIDPTAARVGRDGELTQVVEVAPAYDHAEITALAGATLIYELVNMFVRRAR